MLWLAVFASFAACARCAVLEVPSSDASDVFSRALPGDVILFGRGAWVLDNVSIGSNVTLRGIRGATVLTGLLSAGPGCMISGVRFVSGSFMGSGAAIMDSVFENCTIRIVGGLSSFANVTVMGSSSGAVYLENAGSVRIVDSTFSNNSASNGGAIHAVATDVTILGRSRLEHNAATNDGGAIYMASGVLKIGEDTLCTSNTAANGGCAFAVTVSVSGRATFALNRATSGGGALSVVHFDAGEYAVFRSNAANDGGGVCVRDYSGYVTVSVAGAVRFEANTASWRGGGLAVVMSVYSYGADGSVGISGNAVFLGNRASSGGGLYSGVAHVYMSGNASVLQNAAADSGGGMYCDDGAMFMSGGLVIRGNRAGTGGGVFTSGNFWLNDDVGESGNALFADISDRPLAAITDNWATGSGGGIYSIKSSTYMAGRVSVSRNRASQGGGLGLWTYVWGGIQAGGHSGG